MSKSYPLTDLQEITLKLLNAKALKAVNGGALNSPLRDGWIMTNDSAVTERSGSPLLPYSSGDGQHTQSWGNWLEGETVLRHIAV